MTVSSKWPRWKNCKSAHTTKLHRRVFLNMQMMKMVSSKICNFAVFRRVGLLILSWCSDRQQISSLRLHNMTTSVVGSLLARIQLRRTFRICGRCLSRFHGFSTADNAATTTNQKFHSVSVVTWALWRVNTLNWPTIEVSFQKRPFRNSVPESIYYWRLVVMWTLPEYLPSSHPGDSASNRRLALDICHAWHTVAGSSK